MGVGEWEVLSDERERERERRVSFSSGLPWEKALGWGLEVE